MSPPRRSVERTRQLVFRAAALWDAGAPDATPALFAAKIEVAEACVAATNAAMNLLGRVALGLSPL